LSQTELNVIFQEQKSPLQRTLTGRNDGIPCRSPRYQQPRNIPPDPSTSFAINASSAKTMQEMESLVVPKNLGKVWGINLGKVSE